MINLIPNEEKKNKVKDFYFRLAILFLVVLAVSSSVASAILFPSYFLSLSKKDLISEQLAIQKNISLGSVDKEISVEVKILNNQLSLIEKVQKNKYVVSEKVIKEIISKKMPDIKINQISYNNNATLGKTVSIQGQAPSRERLLLFRQMLEADPIFKKVDLPISNFVKGTDILFSLNLVPA